MAFDRCSELLDGVLYLNASGFLCAKPDDLPVGA